MRCASFLVVRVLATGHVFNIAKPSPRVPPPAKSTSAKAGYAPAATHATNDEAAPAAQAAAPRRKYPPNPRESPVPIAASLSANRKTPHALSLGRRGASGVVSAVQETAAFHANKTFAGKRIPRP